MDNDSIKNSQLDLAVHNLHVKNIYLKKSEIITAEDLDRSKLSHESKICQYFNYCEKLNYFTAEPEDETDTLNHWYMFSYATGVRMLNADLPEADVIQEDVLTEITATFDVFYSSEIELPKEATDEFARRNVQYHVWPFWREFVQSTCGRLGVFPPIEIPSYVISAKKQEN